MRKRTVIRILLAGLGLLLVAVIVGVVILVRSVGPSPACASATDAPVEPGTTTARIVVSGGENRCYLLHVPESYDPETPVPLVITLHGFAGNASQMQEVSHWDEVGEREGFVTVYADGTGFPLRWNTHRIARVNADDVQFMRDMAAQVSTQVAIDPARVYLNGFSNGAGMTAMAACDAADLLAAVGLVEAGGLPAEVVKECDPSRPVPLIEFAGTDDNTLAEERLLEPEYTEPLESPLVYWLFNIEPEALNAMTPEGRTTHWAELNGCTATQEEELPSSVLHIRHGECASDAAVELYLIEGMGHQWPGSEIMLWVGDLSTAVDATETMWQFFTAHPLPTDAD